jgi:2-polyprenyl-6-methoxyphenol hydroxylase-like FAD-dependent oxidoreductase
MWGISRASLDATLLDAARQAGATVLQPARCERIVPGSGPLVQWRCLLTNQQHEQLVDWVIVADGKGAMMGDTATRATGDLGIKAHFTNVAGPRDAIELFGVAGHYGGLAAIEGARWNAAFSVPAARVRQHQGDINAMFQQVASENGALCERLRHARRVTPWLASPLPRFGVNPGWPSHVIPIGNAAAALEPIGGEGMGLAIRSAELAVDALVDARRGRHGPAADLPRRFDQLWRTRGIVCRLVARLVSSPTLADAVAPLFANNARMANAFLTLTGNAGKCDVF